MGKYNTKKFGKVKLWYATHTPASTVVISSHGGLMAYDEIFTAPALLRFRCHVNQTTRGNVSAMLSVSDSEFQDEPKGTKNIRNEILTRFPDKDKDVRATVEGGLDVLTINGRQSQQFEPIADWLVSSWRYQAIICLFCRVPTEQTKINVMNF